MTTRSKTPANSVSSGRLGESLVPALPSSSTCIEPAVGLPACLTAEPASAKAGATSRSTARASTRSGALARDGEPSPIPGTSGMNKGLRRGKRGRACASSDSSPEVGRKTAIKTGKKQVRRDASVSFHAEEISRALDAVYVLERLKVYPLEEDEEGVTIQEILSRAGCALSPVRNALQVVERSKGGLAPDKRCEELEESLRDLRAKNARLEEQVKTLQKQMEEMKKAKPSTSRPVAGIGSSAATRGDPRVRATRDPASNTRVQVPRAAPEARTLCRT